MCASKLLGAMPGVRATESKNTLMVMAFSRHGARAPTNLEYAEKLAKDGPPFKESRELSEYGVKQHFEMGK